jgi:hypothetical protein
MNAIVTNVIIDTNAIDTNAIDTNAIDTNAIDTNAIDTKNINSCVIFSHYVNVMNNYLTHFSVSEKYKKRDKDCNYLLINGLTTLTHVFKITLNQQLPVTQAIENTENAMYYYTQFIEQMDENILVDLNVSSNNASLFVYKKTIPSLLIEPKTTLKMRNVEELLRIYNRVFENLMKDGYNYLIPTKLIKVAIEICRNTSDEVNLHKKMNNVMLFINHFPEMYMYDHIYLYIKKYMHRMDTDAHAHAHAHADITLEKLCNKKAHYNYAEKLNETPHNYIKWLLS